MKEQPLKAVELPASKLTKKQTKTYRKDFVENGDPVTIVAKVRYDDECGNGHNSFSITGTIYEKHRIHGETTTKHKSGKTLYSSCGGCIHDQIEKHFPELAPLIKWHLTSSDGPMSYFDNTCYHAGNRDCWGRKKGEPSRYEYGVKFDGVPVVHRLPKSFHDFLQDRVDRYSTIQVIAIGHPPDKTTSHKYAPKYTFVGYGDKWHECPFDDKAAADQMAEALNLNKVWFDKTPTDFSEGKERQLDSARHSAVWPEATDEQLSQESMKLAIDLAERFPALMAEFKKDVESLGFTY